MSTNHTIRAFALWIASAAFAVSLAGCVPQGEYGWVPGIDGPEWTYYKIVGNEAIVQGDMVYVLDELREFQATVDDTMDPNQPIPYAAPRNNVWPGGILIYDEATVDRFEDVCYDFDDAAPDLDGDGIVDPGEVCVYSQANAIRDAMYLLEANTDVRFEPLVPGSGDHYIRFEKMTSAPGGRAETGYKTGWLGRKESQYVKLNRGCGTGCIAHELGHSMGFKHEHSRTDRDNFVEVHTENLENPGSKDFGINTRGWGDYDYRSIMHYDRFNSSITGQPTIVPRIDIPSFMPGWGPDRNSDLSKIEIAAWNAMVVKGQFGWMPSDYRVLFEHAGDFPNSSLPLPQEVVAYDLTGDDRVDLIGFAKGSQGEVLFAMAIPGDRIGSTSIVQTGFCMGANSTCGVADVDGDGDGDLVSFDPLSEQLIVSLRDRGAFLPPELWGLSGFMPGAELELADVNGDCRVDAVLLEWDAFGADVDVRVMLSTGTGFTTAQHWGHFDGVAAPGLADLDGDGDEDLVLAEQNGDVWVHTANGNTFTPGDHAWITGYCTANRRCVLTDIDWDGVPDLVAERQNHHIPHFLHRLQIAINMGDEFSIQIPIYHEMDCQSEHGCLYGDFDGDGRTDVIEPFASQTSGVDGDRVYVSLNNGLWYDDGILNPLRTGVPSAECIDAPPPTGSSSWEQVATWPVWNVVGTRYDAFVYSGADGNTYRYQGWSSWAKTSNATIDLAATDDDLFKLLADGTVARRKGDLSWGGKGGGMIDIHGGGSGLFATSATGRLMALDCYCAGSIRTGWTDLGPAGTQVEVGGRYADPMDDATHYNSLYRLDAAGVWSFNFWTMTWRQIGGPAGHLYAGADKLYATNPTGSALYAYDVYTDVWRWVSGRAAEFAIDEQSGALVKLTPQKDSIWKLMANDVWVKIGGPADRVWLAASRTWAADPTGGTLWQLPSQ